MNFTQSTAYNLFIQGNFLRIFSKGPFFCFCKHHKNFPRTLRHGPYTNKLFENKKKKSTEKKDPRKNKHFESLFSLFRDVKNVYEREETNTN